MALCPDRETTAAYEALRDARGCDPSTGASVRRGRRDFGRRWRMEVDGDVWRLYHYGTLILTADERSGRTDTGGGWSISDRDKMNGLCRLLYGMARFSRRGEEIVED